MTTNTQMIIWDDNKKLEEVRKLFAPKLTDMEFQFFVGLGKATNLNPFTREIWSIKYQDNMPAQVFVGRDGYRKASQAHPDYDFHQADAVYDNDDFSISNGEVSHTYRLKDRGNLVGAYCIVKRKSSSRPVYVFVELKEYYKPQSVWKEKPATMIKKVSEAQCLRMAFQDLLGGTYCPEEIETNQLIRNAREIEGTTQTERLKNTIEYTELPIETEKSKPYYSGRDDIQINEEQIDEICSLMKELDFTEERRQKAMDYYKVSTIEELTDAQARLLLLQLSKG